MNKDSGGPAFPTSHSPGYPHEITGGMTLRDYFAARAMQGMLAAPYNAASDQFMTARDAYAVADAMLVERAK